MQYIISSTPSNMSSIDILGSISLKFQKGVDKLITWCTRENQWLWQQDIWPGPHW